MKWHKIQHTHTHTRWVAPSPTHKWDRKRWFGSKEKAPRAADIISRIQDCSVLVINDYVRSNLFIYRMDARKMRRWSPFFLKNSELKGKTTCTRGRDFQASWKCVPCHESCIIWISSLCLPSLTMTLHTNYFVPTAAKGGGRKWILLKRINRHIGSRVPESSDVFCSW